MEKNIAIMGISLWDGIISGFTLADKRVLPSLSMRIYRYVHDKTGAIHVHCETPDVNKAFCIGFRTPTTNDKGIPHVLEHTVLCGSKKYPVKDPFFMMLRRSLANFMNAMTGSDYTLYPFSTTNKKDYNNLLDVYLNAVFHPLLRLEHFKQEGHRLELDQSGHVRFNGVVFNEMKGVVSGPESYFTHMLQKKILGDTHYRFISGGDPPQIVELTHEDLLEFHKIHYHPSNCVSMTYGTVDPSMMETINQYFSEFDKGLSVPVSRVENFVDSEQTFKTMGPPDVMGDPATQTRVIYSIAIPPVADTPDGVIGLVVLNELLSSGPSSPMYSALIDSRLGSNYAPGTGFMAQLSTPLLSYGVEGVKNYDDAAPEKIKNAIVDSYKNAYEEGFDQRRVDSIVFQQILQQKHRDSRFGVEFLTGLATMMLVKPHHEVLEYIDLVPSLQKISADYKKALLPLIEKVVLNNSNKILLTVAPDENFLEKLNTVLQEKEQIIENDLSAEDKIKIKNETENWLKQAKKEADVSVLPSLHVSDIPLQGICEPTPKLIENNVYQLACPTNGLVYVHGIIPLDSDSLTLLKSNWEDDLNKKALLKRPLLHYLIGKTGAGSMDYKELSIAIESTMSGFGVGEVISSHFSEILACTMGAAFSFYTTIEKLPAAMNLVEKLFSCPKTTGVEQRIEVLTCSRAANLAQDVLHSGHKMAALKAGYGVSSVLSLQELYGGLSQVDYSTAVLSLENKDEYMGVVWKEYEEFAHTLHKSVGNSLLWFACDETNADIAAACILKFKNSFSLIGSTQNGSLDCIVRFNDTLVLNDSRNLDIPLHIDTGFAGMVIPHKYPFCTKRMQHLRVASSLLANEFLHKRIREEGGAYGSSCSASTLSFSHGICMTSYRDPSPHKSIASFKEAADWLRDSQNITDERLEQAKLTIFAQIDAPKSPDQYGGTFFLTKATKEMLDANRKVLLETTREDVASVAAEFDVTNRTFSSVVLTPDMTGTLDK